MSVLRKKPYIEEQLAKLTGPQLVQLRTAMNNNGPETFYSLVDSSHFIPENQGIIAAVRLEVEKEKPAYNGILISTSDVCMLIGYHRFQDLALFEIELGERTYRRIKEYCDINELRRCLDDALETEVPDFDVTAETIDSGEATAGQVLTANGEGGAAWEDAGGGLPEVTKAGQVVVSNDELEPEWKKSVPLADNLLANPINNDALYSSGPTGGLADITTGEESYLQEVKGYSIVWNQLLDSEHSLTPIYSHKYIRYRNGIWSLIQNASDVVSASLYDKWFDLTLMFGGNDKIPFSLVDETEYPANGNLPAQTVTSVMRFQRLFANVDLVNAPYDAGTIKNVKATQLVETGRNLWDASMETDGLQLLAGYTYEIYLTQNGGSLIHTKPSRTQAYWDNSTLTIRTRADGKYVCYFKPTNNCYIQSYSSGNYEIKYVGFVHSGNYCLTTGTNGQTYNTSETIPGYQKHEFSISGIDGLNGLTDNTGKIVVYDTKDYRRVGSMNLADYADVMNYDSAEEGWIISENDLPNDFNVEFQQEYGAFLFQNGYSMSGSGNDIVIDNGSDSVKPTGILLYPLSESVATGESAFEPIPLKSGNDWIVDDMGQEYFIQPANTNCPVNQVSYYYENLKDKLQNLPEPVEVTAASWNVTDQGLNGLKVGNITYKIIPHGNYGSNTPNSIAFGIGSAIKNNADYSVVFGYYAKAEGQHGTSVGAYSRTAYNYGVAIGHSANCFAANGVAIGYNANPYVSFAIAIGSFAVNPIPDSATFDGTYDVSSTFKGGQRTWHCYNPGKVFFRNEYNDTSKQTFASYASGHFLSEYIQNNELVLESGKYYISYTDADNFKTFSNNRISGTDNDITASVTGVHLTVKLSNNVVASLDLLPYDSQAFTAYGIASDTPTFVSAYIDSDGCVVVTPPSGVTVTSVMYNLK